MIDALPPQERSWLETFFSGRNALKWDAIVGDNAPAAWLELVTPWLATFSDKNAELPIVLPVFDEHGPCQWYGLAQNESVAASLSQELVAVVGPSYSDFCGQPLLESEGDEIECALQKRFGHFIFFLRPLDIAARDSIAQALKTYLGLLRRRPDIPDRTQRPFGKIRAEFDRALLAGNEADALQLRDELVASGRVDAEQHKYLEIRMLAGLGRQHQLARDSHLLKSVLGLALPAQIVADVVEALYVTFIAPVENNQDVETILTVFRNDIARQFGPLFKERKGIRQPNVLKAFLLYELAQEEPNVARCEAIAAAYPANEGRELVEYWADRLAGPPPPRADSFELTRQALADEDYELALSLSFDGLPQSWVYPTMLRCAVELDDAEVTEHVLAAVSKVPEEDRATWSKRDIKRMQQLLEETSGGGETHQPPKVRPDADWLSWVRFVEAGNYDQPPLNILNDGLARWAVESYATDTVACHELADKIGNARGNAEQVFRDAFTQLVDFFVDRPASPVRGFVPIYIMLLRTVAWNGVVSANELELASTVLQALLSLGPSKEDYVEALDAYTEILNTNNAPGNIDWALNASEALSLLASPDKEVRLRFFVAVIDMVRSSAHRLNSAQYEILSLLAKDYGCADLLDAFPTLDEGAGETDAHADFEGLIGIYTLTEPAGQRARQFLRKILPLARIELNADMVATDKLKNLAANSDIFVFAWKSSKHQAYYAAKYARGTRQTLLPLGKGSASIIGCVLSGLERSA